DLGRASVHRRLETAGDRGKRKESKRACVACQLMSSLRQFLCLWSNVSVQAAQQIFAGSDDHIEVDVEITSPSVGHGVRLMFSRTEGKPISALRWVRLNLRDLERV